MFVKIRLFMFENTHILFYQSYHCFLMEGSDHPADNFRNQYAVLAKHILCQKTHLKIYQVQRSFRNTKMAVKGVKPLLKPVKKILLKKVMSSALVKSAAQIGASVVALIGGPILIGIGILAGIAIGAALIWYDYKHPTVRETLGTKIKKALIQEQVDKIQSFLKAYLKCYQNENTFAEYYKTNLNSKGKGYQSNAHIQTLMKYKNYLYQKIKGSEFQAFETHYQIHIAELYYQLVKALIELIAICWNKSVQKQLKELENEHKKIKEIVIKQLRKKIDRKDKQVIINGTSDIKGITIQDPFNLCNEDAFAESIFDQIFQCPLTNYPIDCIYEAQTWTDAASAEKANTVLKKMEEEKSYKYIGTPQNNYSSVKKAENSRIRKMAAIFKQEWACYFEQLQSKIGFHEQKWQNPTSYLDLDSTLVLFINGGSLCYLTSDYQMKKIASGNQMSDTPSSFYYCIEFQSDEIVERIAYDSVFDIRFQTSYRKEQIHNQKQLKSYYSGFIARKDKSQRIGYGAKNPWKFVFTKGFNFHQADSSDSSQKLIFQAINPIEYFQDTSELKKFTCRITTEADKTMYMVRDDRQAERSDFGNNTGGGEVITVSLNKKVAKVNQYEGSLNVVGNQVYVSGSGNLKWSSTKAPSGRQTTFYIYINQC